MQKRETKLYTITDRKENQHKRLPVSSIGRKIKSEGRYRGLFMQNTTCFHSCVFLQLLETGLEQGKTLGPDHAHFSLLAGTREGIN